MLNKYVIILVLIIMAGCKRQTGADELLDLSISYHDPENNWPLFSDSLTIKMESPGLSDRLSHIFIDLPKDEFYLKTIRDSIQTESLLKGERCVLKLNGSEEFSNEEAVAYRLNCDRARMYKNYYTYLYGLPMKLRDEGTQITPQIESREFMGKTYDVIEVKYDPETGSDIWYFYFDPANHAMEIYQFFKTDEAGNKIVESGEYIILQDHKEISGIKMPKSRAWYYNKDDTLLGTDILQ